MRPRRMGKHWVVLRFFVGSMAEELGGAGGGYGAGGGVPPAPREREKRMIDPAGMPPFAEPVHMSRSSQFVFSWLLVLMHLPERKIECS